MIARMISAASFEVIGFWPFAAGIRDHAPIPARAAPRRTAILTRYNTVRSAELRNHGAGAPVRQDRWNTR
jgi:hypothetical protein